MQVSQSLLKLCREVITGVVDNMPCDPDVPVPSDLVATYYRRDAAEDIGKNFCGHLFGEAALLRGALTGNDDDRVRIECLQHLVNNESTFAEIAFLALLLDDDPLLRLAALEGLVIIKSPHRDEAARLLKNDSDEDTATTAGTILAGRTIRLCELDAPEARYP